MKRICLLVTVLAIVMMAFGCSDDKKKSKPIKLTQSQESSLEEACKNADKCGAVSSKECVSSFKEDMGEGADSIPSDCERDLNRLFSCVASAECKDFENEEMCSDEMEDLLKCFEEVLGSADEDDDDDNNRSDNAIDISASANAYCSKIDSCGLGSKAKCLEANSDDDYSAECAVAVKKAYDCMAKADCDDMLSGESCASEIQAAAAKGCIEAADFSDDEEDSDNEED